MTKMGRLFGIVCAGWLALGACSDSKAPCLATATQPCSCGDAGLAGTQVCGDAGTWGTCDCEEDGLGGSSGGSTPDGSGGTSTSSGGSGGGGNAGSAVSDGGMASMDAASSDAASSGDTGAGDAGAGDAAVGNYLGCGDGDAGPQCPDGQTCRTTFSSPNGVCAAECQENGDCLAPPGDYEATPACAGDNTCRLDCGPMGVPPFPRTCPEGMICRVELGTNSCYPE